MYTLTHLFGVGGRGEGLLSDGLVLVTQSLVGLLVILRHAGQESAAQRVGPLRQAADQLVTVNLKHAESDHLWGGEVRTDTG